MGTRSFPVEWTMPSPARRTTSAAPSRSHSPPPPKAPRSRSSRPPVITKPDIAKPALSSTLEVDNRMPPKGPAYVPAAIRAPIVTNGPVPVFKIGDKAVHPSHGLGEITAIEKREFAGTSGLYYILRILDNGMKVMVPTTAVAQAGLRGVMSSREADGVLTTMRAREVAVDLQPWSRRFRAYTEMLKSGLPHEVAKVLRDMHRLRFDKDLSFGERRLLDQAKSLLVKELAVAKKMTEVELLAEVSQIFKA
jgi:CarD family transcriptional regulator